MKTTVVFVWGALPSNRKVGKSVSCTFIDNYMGFLRSAEPYPFEESEMSASKERFTYHLTPGGWVRGSERIDFSGWNHKPIPEDNVLTVVFCEDMSSSFSAIHFSVDLGSAKDGADIKELLLQHGTDPHVNSMRYNGWREFIADNT